MENEARLVPRKSETSTFTLMITRILISVGLVVATAGVLLGQGYGGASQPRTSQPIQPPASQPMQPQQEKKQVVVVAGGSDVTAGITQYFDNASKKSSDKKLHIKHEGQDIALGSLKVRENGMADLGGGKYVACTNMQGADGKKYDIDFFLAGERGNLKVTKTSVHKIDGNALYSWKRQGGVWKMSR